MRSMSLSERIAAFVQQKERRLAELRAEANQIEGELAAIARLVDANSMTLPLPSTAQLFPPAVSVERPPKHGSSVDWTIRVLEETGTPMHIDNIISAIKERSGETVQKPTLVSNLSRYIKAGQKFVRTAESTYGLKGRDDVAA